MPRGGHRTGAGRKPGFKSEATKRREEVALKALQAGTTPLDVMLEAMKEAYEEGGAKAAMPFAKEAAPYVHPKLANVDSKVNAFLEHYTAQPIPTESRDSDSMAGPARPTTEGDPARSN